jgi:hypothetical protein
MRNKFICDIGGISVAQLRDWLMCVPTQNPGKVLTERGSTVIAASAVEVTGSDSEESWNVVFKVLEAPP